MLHPVVLCAAKSCCTVHEDCHRKHPVQVFQYAQASRPACGMLIPSGHIGFQRVSVGTLFWHDETRHGSTGRLTVPHRCTIDVWTHAGPSGGPTRTLGPRRDPTDPRRTAGGTVEHCLIGASPVWACPPAQIADGTDGYAYRSIQGSVPLCMPEIVDVRKKLKAGQMSVRH